MKIRILVCYRGGKVCTKRFNTLGAAMCYVGFMMTWKRKIVDVIVMARMED